MTRTNRRRAVKAIHTCLAGALADLWEAGPHLHHGPNVLRVPVPSFHKLVLQVARLIACELLEADLCLLAAFDLILVETLVALHSKAQRGSLD